MDTLVRLIDQHAPAYVLAAAAICLFSGAIAQPLLGRAATASVRWFWMLVSGGVIGSTVWSVHFTAMLGYEPGGVIRYAPSWTALSLLVSIAGMCVLAITMRLPQNRLCRAVQAGLFVLPVALMHHTGMMGVQMGWVHHSDGLTVMLSLLLAAAPALVFVYPDPDHSYRVARRRRTLGFAATVIVIHFGGMAAMRHGAPLPVAEGNLVSPALLGSTVFLVTLVIMLAGSAIVFLERQNTRMFARRTLEGQFVDPDTNLANRNGVVRWMHRLTLQNTPFTLVGMRLIGFREMRGLAGRGTTQHWIAALARRLEDAANPAGQVGYAGDGVFYLLFEGPDDATRRLKRIRRSLPPWSLQNEDTKVPLKTAVALVQFPQDAETAEEAADFCDFTLAGAGAQKRTTLLRFERDRLEDQRRSDRLAVDIGAALRDNSLELHYQPQARIEPGGGLTVVGFEALARWNHPELGRISPQVFVPLLDAQGLNSALAQWALVTACAEFSDLGGTHSIAVNIPPDLLVGDRLPGMVQSALLASGLAPGRLEIEVTESGLIADMAAARHCIAALHALGVSVSLDDFGTGYASLQTLFEIPLDKIKLDQTFLRGSGGTPRSSAIVEAAALIARRLNATLLAEGVETQEHLTLVTGFGYDLIQGYLVSPPLPAQEMRQRYGGGPQVAQTG